MQPCPVHVVIQQVHIWTTRIMEGLIKFNLLIGSMLGMQYAWSDGATMHWLKIWRSAK